MEIGSIILVGENMGLIFGGGQAICATTGDTSPAPIPGGTGWPPLIERTRRGVFSGQRARAQAGSERARVR